MLALISLMIRSANINSLLGLLFNWIEGLYDRLWVDCLSRLVLKYHFLFGKFGRSHHKYYFHFSIDSFLSWCSWFESANTPVLQHISNNCYILPYFSDLFTHAHFFYDISCINGSVPFALWIKVDTFMGIDFLSGFWMWRVLS